MQKVFEKIKERLEKERKEIIKWDSDKHYIYIEGADWMGAKSIEIVDQVAKEFAADVNVGSNIVCKLKEFLKEKKKYNSEQADIWRDGAYKDAYFRQNKDLYMDRANVFGSVLREVDRLCKEYESLPKRLTMDNEKFNDGWIPCSERLPECEDYSETDALLFQLGSGTIEVGYFGKKNAWRDYYFRHYRGISGVDAKDVVAWQPLPEPYKEEK